MPSFHDLPRGMTGHASSPSRCGPHRLPHVDVRVAEDQHVRGVRPAAPRPARRRAHSLVPGTRWSTSTPSRRPGPGREVARRRRQVVDAVEQLDDDALDPQVVAPHLLDELGVVPALDEDPRAARDPGPLRRRRPRDPLAVRAAAARAVEPASAAAPRRGERRPGRRRGGSPGPRGNALGAPAPVLEVHDVHAAGLLDAHHGAAPSRSRRPRRRGPARRRPRRATGRAGASPVAGRARRRRSGRHGGEGMRGVAPAPRVRRAGMLGAGGRDPSAVDLALRAPRVPAPRRECRPSRPSDGGEDVMSEDRRLAVLRAIVAGLRPDLRAGRAPRRCVERHHLGRLARRRSATTWPRSRRRG